MQDPDELEDWGATREKTPVTHSPTTTVTMTITATVVFTSQDYLNNPLLHLDRYLPGRHCCVITPSSQGMETTQCPGRFKELRPLPRFTFGRNAFHLASL
jgi:hypothetical protein